MLRAVDKCHGHLVGVAPLQLGIAVDINDREALAGLGTNSGHLRDRLVTQMAALSREYDDPLCPLGELDHITIFHDAGEVTSEGRRMRRPMRVIAISTAPPTMDSTETSRNTSLVAPTI